MYLQTMEQWILFRQGSEPIKVHPLLSAHYKIKHSCAVPLAVIPTDDSDSG